jgi:nucleoside-diphosphate-sugar epimerase
MSVVLVTGGAGLIGATVCRRLRDGGHRVVATCWQNAAPDLGPGIEWRQCDLRTVKGLDDLRADAVAHCAAALPLAFDAADLAARTNRAIDETVFRLVDRTAAPLVYASTASLYGETEPDGPAGFTEVAPIVTDAPYQAEKAWAESRGRELADRIGSRFTALRINAPFGPGQRTQTVLMRFIADASAGRALRYYGEGTREQDFTYVDDVAAAFEAGLGRPDGVFNISAGAPISMRDLARLVAELTGLDLGLVEPAGVPDPQEGRRARFDISAARHGLGWVPHTPLRDGIVRCLAGRDRST